MPNASELERERQEAQLSDADVVLDGLQVRVKKLGFDSVTAAIDYLEGLQNG